MYKRVVVVLLIINFFIFLRFFSVREVTGPINNEPEKVIQRPTSDEKLTGKRLPAEVIAHRTEGSLTYLILDVLEHNPEWTPGGPHDLYLNNTPDTYEVVVNSETKALMCTVEMSGQYFHGPDNDPTTADMPMHISIYLNKYNSGVFYDVDNGVVTAIYEQCLP